MQYIRNSIRNTLFRNTRATQPIIDDTNIRQFVHAYLAGDTAALPIELRGVKIGKWNVSRVTDMSHLFDSATQFNESINDWDVRNVTNMSYMFANAHNFNKPLNKWKTGNVIYMSHMFFGAESFNQNINTNGNYWNVSNVTNIDSMFVRARAFNQSLSRWNLRNVNPMPNFIFEDAESMERMPHWYRPGELQFIEPPLNHPPLNQPPLNHQPGVPSEVHRMSDKLITKPQFLKIIQADKEQRLDTMDYNSIKERFISFIQSPQFTHSDKPSLINKFKTIITKISLCAPPSSETANRINRSIEFAFAQDPKFTSAYIEIFIDETFHAYRGQGDTLSCVKGIYERFSTCLLSAALQVSTLGSDFEMSTELTLLTCFEKTGDAQKDPNEMIQSWSESWQKDGKLDEWKSMNTEDRKTDLKNYMIEQYKLEECYEINREQIESIIDGAIRRLGSDVFTNNEQAAYFGGRRNRNRKTKKSKLNAKTNKLKGKKSRKTRF